MTTTCLGCSLEFSSQTGFDLHQCNIRNSISKTNMTLKEAYTQGFRAAIEESAYQSEIYYGPGAGPHEAWRAGAEIAEAIREIKEE